MSKIGNNHTLRSAWRLGRATWKAFRPNWLSYAKILAVVSVPINLLSLFGSLTTDATMNAYTSIASIVMNVALIWAIVRAEKTGEVPRISSSYYDGSVAIVRYLLVTVLLVLMLLPAAFAAAIYLASMSSINTTSSLPEQLLIGTVCVLIALPSFWLIIRFGLAPIAAVDTGLPPIAALRYARNITIGHFWSTLAHYALLGVYIICLAIPIALITALLSFLKLGPIPTIFFQLATTFIVLPLANIYLLKLMHNLDQQSRIVTDGNE